MAGYRAAHPTGFAYSQFCERYRAWARKLKPSMRQVHRAGEKLFVDFSGKRPHLVDPTTGWKTFLAAHWDGLAAADFFTVEVLTWGGRVRYVVFFAMKAQDPYGPDRRDQRSAGRCLDNADRAEPDGPPDGFLRDVKYIILDQDSLYTATFSDLLRDSEVTPLRLPARSPNLNAFAERFVGSVRAECLARLVPLGEGHLRTALRAFVDHYHEERPHQGRTISLSRPRLR